MASGTEAKENGRMALGASLAVLAILVGGLLLLLISLRHSLEQAVSNLATLLPVGYAFAAGMVASVNPCGALMLPSYIFFQLGTEETQASTLERLLKALRIAIATTAGFTAIFGLVGLVVSAEHSSIQTTLGTLQALKPWADKTNVILNQIAPTVHWPTGAVRRVLGRVPVGVIPFDPTQAEALREGKPLALHSPGAPLAEAIRALAADFVRAMGGAAA